MKKYKTLVETIFFIILCEAGLFVEFGKDVEIFIWLNILMVSFLSVAIIIALILRPRKGEKTIPPKRYLWAILFIIFSVSLLFYIQFKALGL